mmetsp:Transcript_1769/g.5126  ORF Transcript_1769/g.5126 Transcript_1769/m.5126 type:complete len:202 (+) Transcript_1769:2327-2932(+)
MALACKTRRLVSSLRTPLGEHIRVQRSLVFFLFFSNSSSVVNQRSTSSGRRAPSFSNRARHSACSSSVYRAASTPSMRSLPSLSSTPIFQSLLTLRRAWLSFLIFSFSCSSCTCCLSALPSDIATWVNFTDPETRSSVSNERWSRLFISPCKTRTVMIRGPSSVKYGPYTIRSTRLSPARIAFCSWSMASQTGSNQVRISS